MDVAQRLLLASCLLLGACFMCSPPTLAGSAPITSPADSVQLIDWNAISWSQIVRLEAGLTVAPFEDQFPEDQWTELVGEAAGAYDVMAFLDRIDATMREMQRTESITSPSGFPALSRVESSVACVAVYAGASASATIVFFSNGHRYAQFDVDLGFGGRYLSIILSGELYSPATPRLPARNLGPGILQVTVVRHAGAAPDAHPPVAGYQTRPLSAPLWTDASEAEMAGDQLYSRRGLMDEAILLTDSAFAALTQQQFLELQGRLIVRVDQDGIMSGLPDQVAHVAVKLDSRRYLWHTPICREQL